MKLQAINLDWRTKTINIKNKTTRTLKNGVVIPTTLAMMREVSKI